MAFFSEFWGRVLKRILKILKWLSFSLLCLVILVAGVALAVITWPKLVLNDRTLAWAARYAGSHGYAEIKWDEGYLDVSSLSWLKKRVKLDLSGLCVKLPDERLEGCFSRVQLSAAAGLGGFRPRVLELGPVTVLGSRLSMRIPEGSPKGEEQSYDKPSGELIPEFIREARVFPIQIDLSQLRLKIAESEYRGAIQLDSGVEGKSVGLGESAKISVKAQIESLNPGKKPDRMDGEAYLQNPHGFARLETWGMNAKATAQLADKTWVNANIELEPTPGSTQKSLNYNYRLDGGYVPGKPWVARGPLGRVVLVAKGNLSPNAINARLSARAIDLVPSFRRVSVRDCDLSLARRSSETEPGEVKVNCPVYALLPLPPKGFPNIKIPAEMGGTVTVDVLTGAFPPSPDSRVAGRLGVELDPILTPLFEGSGNVMSQVDGIPSEFPRSWKMDTDLGLALKIPRFEVLVKQLEKTPWAIWAPARVLKGSVELATQGRFDANQGSAPVSLQTRLSSENQKLNIDAKGEVTLAQLMPSPKAHLDMDVNLTEVVLELPPLPGLPTPTQPKPDDFPAFAPDSRIKRVSAQGMASHQEVFAFTYSVRIRSPGARPVMLKTEIAKGPVPLGVDVVLSDSLPLSGSLDARAFPFDLFHREVRLERFGLKLKSPSSDSELDGALKIAYTDYTITILVVGTTAKPKVRFMSDPPLPENQILAVLLFGQKLDSLDPEQSEASSKTGDALREGALSLLSLYYLSSLNIQSVDYDPQTGNVELRYSLGEGTSLSVSEGGGEEMVGIRRRLSKRWSITTALNHPGDPTDRSVSTLLEWGMQY